MYYHLTSGEQPTRVLAISIKKKIRNDKLIKIQWILSIIEISIAYMRCQTSINFSYRVCV